jgi:hypothetical protein
MAGAPFTHIILSTKSFEDSVTARYRFGTIYEVPSRGCSGETSGPTAGVPVLCFFTAFIGTGHAAVALVWRASVFVTVHLRL